MARLVRRSIRFYSGFDEVKKFQRWEDDPDSLFLEVLDLQNGEYDRNEYKIQEHTIQQYAIIDEDEDWQNDFWAAQVRVNGGELITITDDVYLPEEFFDKACKGADSNLKELFKWLFYRRDDLYELYETFKEETKKLGLNRSMLPWPNHPSIEFTKEELESFDLSRFYAITIAFDFTDVDDDLVMYIPLINEKEPEDWYFEGAEGSREFLIGEEQELKTVSLPVFAELPEYDSQAIYIGDINDLEYDEQYETCGYATAQKEGAPIVINLSDFGLTINA